MRGYGLVDSPKVKATPGRILNLKAIIARSRAAAAEYYPANYWYALLKIPDKSEFPLGKVNSQGQWLAGIKTLGCNSCHQLGNKATRTISKSLGEFKTYSDA